MDRGRLPHPRGIYFNGAGVKRDIPLAIRFACESEVGLAKLALPEIAKLHGSPHTAGPFEFCDDAASTLTLNFCGSYASEIEENRRNRFYNWLNSSMTPEQQTALEKLLVAEKAYTKTHALEVDQGGSIRGVRTLGSQRILEELFRTDVVHFERRKWPSLSANQLTMADTSLHREFMKAVLAVTNSAKEAADQGAVTAASLYTVQESWQNYRDAWFAFARLRYPGGLALIRAKITLDRCRLLKTIR